MLIKSSWLNSGLELATLIWAPREHYIQLRSIVYSRADKEVERDARDRDQGINGFLSADRQTN